MALLSTVKAKKAIQHDNKEILMNAAGNRIKSNDNETVEAENKLIPSKYQQNSYPLESGYIWLIVCLVIRPKDSNLADYLLTKYEMDFKAYEGLQKYIQGSNFLPNLDYLFNNYKICYMQVGRVKPKGKYSNNVTGFTLEGITVGLFIMVLQDTSGGNTHAIGINRRLNVIYDCMETHEIQLNIENLSKYCGPNRDFDKFCHIAELRDNKVHAKKN